MKKLFLSTFLLGSLFTAKAQIIFSENFNGVTAPTGWTINDADGDGDNWTIEDNSTHPRAGVASGGKMLVSLSFDNNSGPLTPNNYIFSPAINLSTYTGKTIKLKWKVAAQDEDWTDETYSVYASTTNTIAGMLASSTVLSNVSASNIIDLTPKELDISVLGGQSTVYFAFRHHNSTDNFAIVIDDIEVLAVDPASSQQFFAENFSLYPNPTSDVLNISSKNGLEMKEIKITDLSGRIVKTLNNTTTINVYDLSAGTYLIDITTNQGKASSKFVKK